MTSHKEALEAAAKAYWGDHWPMMKKSHPGITEAMGRAVSAYLSALSPYVSELVRRLRIGSGRQSKYDTKLDNEAADALASLSLQLAAVEGERERLRAAIIKAVDPSSAGIGGIESAEDGVAYMAGVLLPALGIGEAPSKENKT